ncbi:MAG: hypothetical protein TUN42_09695 [Dehalogenimonas sp.]
MTSNIDTNALKKALAQYGNLAAANEALAAANQATKSQNKKLSDQNTNLVADNEALLLAYAQKKKEVESIATNYAQLERQYRLFEAFLWMLASSPSSDQPLQNLIDLLIELKTKWKLILLQNAKKARQIFVSNVLGDYLKSYKCGKCGVRFMTDGGPSYPQDRMCCPSCHWEWNIEADDGFVMAMIGEENLKELKRVTSIEEQNQALKPLKFFLELPCEICNKPMASWTLEDIKRGAEGFGWGHTVCFKSESGQIRQSLYLLKYLKNSGRQ